MNPQCPALDSAAITTSLASVDCHLGALVVGGYERLFGGHGLLLGMLTAVLTIYVALIAYGLMFGRLSLSVSAVAPKMAVIALVLTFATSWPAYQTVVFNVMMRGPDEIASAFAPAGQGGVIAFTSRLDRTLHQVQSAIGDLDADAPRAAPSGAPPAADAQGGLTILKDRNVQASALLKLCAFLLVLGTLGLLIIARVMVTTLLAIGPVFIVLALFQATRGLFEGWMRTTLMFSAVPLIVVLSGSAGLMIVDPLVAAISRDPFQSAADQRAIGALLFATVIDLLLMVAAAVATAGIAKAWRPLSSANASAPGVKSGQRPDDQGMGQKGGAGGHPGAQAFDRVAEVISAASRSSGAVPPPSLAPIRVLVGKTHATQTDLRPRRYAGLGRSAQRPPPKHIGLDR